MGRHSRGAADSSPPPPPEPPVKHPYAPRSAEDTGVWDHSTYRVVDVGLPADAPAAFPFGGSRTQAAGPNRVPARDADLGPGPNIAPLRNPRRDSDLGPGPNIAPARNPGPYRDVDLPPGPNIAPLRNPRRDADPGPGPSVAPVRNPAAYRDGDLGPGLSVAPVRNPAAYRDGDLGPGPNLAPSRALGRDADLTPGIASGRTAETLERPAARTALRSVPEADGFRPAEQSRYGATRADLTGMSELRYGATREPRSRHGATRADLAAPRSSATRADSTESRPSATRADLAAPRSSATRADLTGSRPSATRADLAGSRPSGAESRPSEFRADPSAPRLGGDAVEEVESRRRSRLGSEDGERPRYGATRADLAESVGATALAPRESPEPDEVTDTGARRARSTFHLAPETDETQEHDYDEPSLLLQWGIFVAQTLTGAVAGLGVWLGFYRLWSTYPFYAAPSVGAAAILMLVLARTLRRRHGHDLDLMTAIVTIGVATVLTVLPAAFTLQSLA